MNKGKLFEDIDGVLIIRPIEYKKSLSNCPICKLAFRHKEDLIEYNNYGCCLDCSLFFYQPNKKKWNEGWRQQIEEIEKVINKLGE
tara:strand:+ start:552 stop:809 length:258 start_codon:yes stop_codon:yes gene_type:complete